MDPNTDPAVPDNGPSRGAAFRDPMEAARPHEACAAGWWRRDGGQPRQPAKHPPPGWFVDGLSRSRPKNKKHSGAST